MMNKIINMNSTASGPIKLLLISLLLSVTGQSYGDLLDMDQLLEANTGKAIVLLYREDKLAASAIHYRPYLNDVPMAVLTRGTWAYAIVPPGNYDLWLEQYAPKGSPKGVRSRAVESYDWQADKVYFIRVDSVSMPGLVSRAKGEVMNLKKTSEEIGELTSAGKPLLYPTRQ